MKLALSGSTMTSSEGLLSAGITSDTGFGTDVLEQGIDNVFAAASGQIASRLSHDTIYYYASLNVDVTSAVYSQEDSLFYAGPSKNAFNFAVVFDSSPYPWIEAAGRMSYSVRVLVGEDTFDAYSKVAAKMVSRAAVKSATATAHGLALRTYEAIVDRVLRRVAPQFYNPYRPAPIILHDISYASPATRKISVRGRVRKLYSLPPSMTLSPAEWGSVNLSGDSAD